MILKFIWKYKGLRIGKTILKRTKLEDSHVYICNNHFAVHQKLTQHTSVKNNIK